jgi:hypothetical protein
LVANQTERVAFFLWVFVEQSLGNTRGERSAEGINFEFEFAYSYGSTTSLTMIPFSPVETQISISGDWWYRGNLWINNSTNQLLMPKNPEAFNGFSFDSWHINYGAFFKSGYRK